MQETRKQMVQKYNDVQTMFSSGKFVKTLGLDVPKAQDISTRDGAPLHILASIRRLSRPLSQSSSQ